MKVIFDGVFNHVGITHWAFRDVLKNQQDSVYRNWFSVKSWRDERNDIPFLYQGWSGYKELPEFKQDNRGIVAEPKKYIFDITKRWMDPNINGKTIDGIDGWRLDVAYCIKHPFWREWRCHVKQINPEAYITAEVIRPIDELKPYLSGEEFDAVMNYNFTFACSEYIHKKIQTQEFDRLLTDLRHAFHAEITNVQQNLLGSHDTERIGSHIKNGHIAAYRDWKNYHRLTIGKNPLYDSGKPEPKDIALQKLLAVFQMTYVGAPMIYYGDECGMWGANDPDCRKPMLWADLEYQDSAFLPDGGFKSKPDPVCVNGDLFNHYKNLIRIRNNSKALQLGEFKTIQLPTPNECYAFTRTYDNETVLVLLNKSDKTNTITAPDPNCLYFDLISKKKLETLVKDKKIEIPPRSGRILKMQQKP
ncbi:alpha-glucosidase C-terminal domain-containing protein [candidate division KSB1 bacterium]|nr:alpha-glucosidase C-terminal domain-containing protein [candidate division KSB1 bacterium]